MPNNRPTNPTPRRHAPRGFTLLEAALATIIIGVGVLAVVEAQQSFLSRNSWSSGGATATYLASEIREFSRSIPRHDRFSGGIYFVDPADTTTLAGWGTENGENTLDELDDIDDLDGAVFGDATDLPDDFTMSRRYPGPVGADGKMIPETLYDGTTEMIDPGEGEDPIEVGMRGWTQIVRVQKVNPSDITETLANNADVRDGSTILRRVDRYPLRVSVTVLRQDEGEETAEVMTTLSWIVMP